MSLSSWRERAKLGALALVLLLCLATIFTSSSFAMGERNLPPLQVQQQARVLCDKVQTDARKSCENDNNSSATCAQVAKQQGQKCQRAVKHAAQRLNVSRCLRDQQQVILCEMEWCDQSSSGTMSASLEQCRTECAGVRQVLRDCVQAQIQTSLRAFGFELLTTPLSTTATST